MNTSKLGAVGVSAALFLPALVALATPAAALTAPVYECPDGTWDLIRTAGGTHAINIFQKRQTPLEVAARVRIQVAVGWEHANDFSKVLQTIEVDSNIGGPHTTHHQTFIQDNDFFQDACGTPIKFEMGPQWYYPGWVDVKMYNSLLTESVSSSTTYSATVGEYTSTERTGTIFAAFEPLGGGGGISYSETNAYGTSFARTHESGASVAITATLYTVHTSVVVGGGLPDYVTNQVDHVAGGMTVACRSMDGGLSSWHVDRVLADAASGFLAWRLSDGAGRSRYGWTPMPATPQTAAPNFVQVALDSGSGQKSSDARSTGICGDLADDGQGSLTFRWVRLSGLVATRGGTEGAWQAGGLDLGGSIVGGSFTLDATSTTYGAQAVASDETLSQPFGAAGTWTVARGSVDYASGESSLRF